MAAGELDPSSGVPLYRQIKDILRAEISGGTVETGRPMTEAQLLERFGVSRAPIRQALKELADEGYVYRKQGKGTFPVTGARIDRPATVRPGDLYRYLSEQGRHPSSTVAEVSRVQPPSAVRDRLGLDEREKLLHFTRLIAVDDSAFSFNVLYIRAPEDFSPTAGELETAGSAFALLERGFGITLERAEHEAWATSANREQAAALGVSEGIPLLVIDTVFFTTGGVAAGWRSALHLPEEFKFHFVTGP